MPEGGIEHLDDANAKSKDGNYLFDDLARRISGGPISFQILVQVANETDIVANATIHWQRRPSDCRSRQNYSDCGCALQRA